MLCSGQHFMLDPIKQLHYNIVVVNILLTSWNTSFFSGQRWQQQWRKEIKGRSSVQPGLDPQRDYSSVIMTCVTDLSGRELFFNQCTPVFQERLSNAINWRPIIPTVSSLWPGKKLGNRACFSMGEAYLKLVLPFFTAAGCHHG